MATANHPELWRTTVPGDRAHRFLGDPTHRAIFVSDGWSVPYPALRLHRLELDTGAHLADLRTRHQGVYGLTLANGRLYATTDSRLFELSPTNLTILRQWDRGLVRFANQILWSAGRLVLANWLMPSVGIFDPDTGRLQRIRVGRQPLIFEHAGTVLVIDGFDGGLSRLDVSGAKREPVQPTGPIASVAAGREVWAIKAGPSEGGQGDPPVWTRPGADLLLRLADPEWVARLSGPCSGIECDDARGVIWCHLGRPVREVVAVSQIDGRVVDTISPPEGFTIVHLDVTARVAFATQGHAVLHGNVVVNATSTLSCLRL